MEVRRAARVMLLGALLPITGCDSSFGPEIVAERDLLGSWFLESVGCPGGPTLTLHITRAQPTLGGRINLEGRYDFDAPPNPDLPIPYHSGFSGNVDAATGDLELLLWRIGQQRGEMNGTILASKEMTGRLTWGFCRPKAGRRVSGTARAGG